MHITTNETVAEDLRASLKLAEPPPARPQSLAAKLAAVMAAVHRVGKRGRNDFHGYNYATEADIADAIRGELAQRIIVLVPAVDRHERVELPDKGGKARDAITLLHMTFTFMDGETGEMISKTWIGA